MATSSVDVYHRWKTHENDQQSEWMLIVMDAISAIPRAHGALDVPAVKHALVEIEDASWGLTLYFRDGTPAKLIGAVVTHIIDQGAPIGDLEGNIRRMRLPGWKQATIAKTGRSGRRHRRDVSQMTVKR